ncbi:hypothetical protein CSC2_04050 [Clostridium zeae]|uniref:Uncharacterized protein n=1 Tax=Clostridium zeae TaxID=2759022 RepID=A0ABQ1E567_9CLOT|nr:hypothetical protein [Clostridium zeae]GFZ29879.1 hypothetical protein CSC2_04050 [Clostridium zeae]
MVDKNKKLLKKKIFIAGLALLILSVGMPSITKSIWEIVIKGISIFISAVVISFAVVKKDFDER